MDPKPLVNEQVDAGRRLMERLEASVPIKLAFWVMLSDEDEWSLFLASDNVESKGATQGYREVVRICNQLNTPYLEPFQVRLIRTDHPLAIAVREIQERYPDRLPTRYNGKSLGGMSVGGAYFYESPLVVASP
jgi:hypothetical protein